MKNYLGVYLILAALVMGRELALATCPYVRLLCGGTSVLLLVAGILLLGGGQ